MATRTSGIGGQAVLEGIMMKNKDKYAVAVRKPDNDIVVETKEYKGMGSKCKLFGVPFIRGIFAFVDSMVLGVKCLMYSADFFDEESANQEDGPADKVVRSAFKEKAEDVMMGLTVAFSIVLSIALFVLLPYYISEGIKVLIGVNSNTLLAVIEGIARIFVFLAYLILISRMKDIQRTFMYHGAEHKCINCIEVGLNLNVENVRISSRQHKRCGTSFLLFVMFISVIAFILVSAFLPDNTSRLVKVIIRVLLMPVIAGISYEIIRLAGKSDNIIVRALSAPGLLMQKLTTKEPTDDMIEVAIKAVEAVFDWKEYQMNENIYTDESVKEKSGEEASEKLTDYDFDEDHEENDEVEVFEFLSRK